MDSIHITVVWTIPLVYRPPTEHWQNQPRPTNIYNIDSLVCLLGLQKLFTYIFHTYLFNILFFWCANLQTLKTLLSTILLKVLNFFSICCMIDDVPQRVTSISNQCYETYYLLTNNISHKTLEHLIFFNESVNRPSLLLLAGIFF